MKALIFILLLTVPVTASAADPEVMWRYKCVDGTQEFTATFTRYPDNPAWCEYEVSCTSPDKGQYFRDKCPPWMGERWIVKKCLKPYFGFTSRHEIRPKCAESDNWVRQ